MKPRYNPNIWFSPRFAIFLLWKLRDRFGKDVISNRKYKREREAWAVAVALLGIIKRTGVLWWIQIPEEDPPDVLAMTLTPNQEKNQNDANYREVEVMLITKHTNRLITEEILEKMQDKYYNKKTCLLVHIARDSRINDMRELAEDLKGKIHDLADIWLIGNTKPKTNNFILFSLFPSIEVENFNIDEEILKLPIGDVLELERAKGIKAHLIRKEFPWKFNPKSL